MTGTSSYVGPIIDAFLHGPWIGPTTGANERADRVKWIADRRLRRVMQTFRHDGGPDGGPGYLSVPDLLAAMDDAGVERGILATKVYYPSPADSVMALNSSFADMAAQSGGRLKWIASLVPPELGGSSYWDVMQNSRLLDKVAGNPGLCGVHITPSPWGIRPDDRWFYPAYAKCVELGLPLFAYVGAPGPLWPMDLNNPAHLDHVALAFPDLTIIAHHIGDPWTEMAVRLAARHEHFYICTSAWSPKAYPSALKQFLAGKWHGVRGCDKTLFASDFPLLDLETVVRDARAMQIDENQAQAFLYGNAKSLFWS